jgi:uncharacterized protein (TIGR02231 family)
MRAEPQGKIRMRHSVPLVMAILMQPGLAGAAEIEARSTIDSVVVNPDTAQITRLASVDLSAGKSTIVFRGLPFTLDPASLRAFGEAGGRLTIRSVEVRQVPADTRGDGAIDQKLRTLRSEREGWQVTLDALETKRAMIVRFSQSGPEKLSPDAQPLEIGQWNSAWDSVGTGLAKVGDELRSARARAREIDDEIKALEAGRGQKPLIQPARDVAVSIEAEEAQTATIGLSYLISGAGWRPVYDAFLDSGPRPRFEFVRRAIVSQRSGEDWVDVSLSVATNAARRTAAAPNIQPEKIDFFQPPLVQAVTPALAKSALAPANAEAVSSAVQSSARAAEESTAGLETGAYQASFHIPGRVSLATDGAQKSFRISTRNPAVEVSDRAVPLIDPTAYVQVRFVNDEDATLLAGEVMLHRDGAFVGTSRLGNTVAGEQAEFGFGPDEGVQVARVPVKRRENEPTALGATKIQTQEYKTTVKNLHDFPVKMTVIDQVPFSENTAISVELLPTTTPPSEKTFADKRGVMAWSFDLTSGEGKELRLAYRMKWPADREIVLETAPLPH